MAFHTFARRVTVAVVPTANHDITEADAAAAFAGSIAVLRARIARSLAVPTPCIRLFAEDADADFNSDAHDHANCAHCAAAVRRAVETD